MVGNTKIEQQAPIDDRIRLEAEVQQLRGLLRDMSERLDAERAHRTVLQRAVGYATARVRALERFELGQTVELDPVGGLSDGKGGGNQYVFDDEDESRAAFDEFFAAPDPHLEKVRGFLLD
ncbi:MAG: hypothetical protein ACR2QK_19595 [Acidimicrobiales bacterium]